MYRRINMTGWLFIGCCLGVLSGPVSLNALSGNVHATTLPAKQERRRNTEAEKLKNPEPNNSDTVEAGKKSYARHCASCHGPNGKGDGGMALSGGTPSDLTDDTWDCGSTDGEIFTAIKDGVSADMLAYKDKLDDQKIWQIVRFLRSIGPKESK